MVYLVKGQVKEDVIKATEAGEFYSGPLVEGNEVFLIPTGKIKDAVIATVEATKASFKENGGHALWGDDNAIIWDEGTAMRQKSDGKYRGSVKPFIVNGKNVRPKDLSDMKFFWHVHVDKFRHPEIGNYKKKEYGISDNDFDLQNVYRTFGFKGNAFVIDAGSNKVIFYNKQEDETLMMIRLRDFKKMGGR